MSEKKTKAKKNAAGRIGNDLMMTRLSLMLIAAIVAVTAVICVRNANSDANLYRKAAPAMSVIGLVLFIAAAAYAVFRMIKKADNGKAVFTTGNILGMGIVSLLCAGAYYVSPYAASAYAVVMILGAIALYFVLYIYPFEFFMLSLFCLVECMMIYTGFAFGAVNILSVIIVNICKYGALVLPLLMAAAALLYKKKHKKAWAIPSVVCAAVALVGVAAILITAMHIYIPASIVIIAVVAVYLAFGIAVTVRMI